MRCGCLDHEVFQVKKGRGQRKNRRNREGREQHRSLIVFERYFAWCEKQGLTVEQARTRLMEFNK